MSDGSLLALREVESRLGVAERLSACIGEPVRMARTMVALYRARFRQVPRRITLDIDDTFDAVHGGQKLRVFNAYYGEYGFQPMVVTVSTKAGRAHRLATSGADIDGLVPLVDAAQQALGRKPVEVSADTGFASEADLEAMAAPRMASTQNQKYHRQFMRHPPAESLPCCANERIVVRIRQSAS